jgi:hypothetical protein
MLLIDSRLLRRGDVRQLGDENMPGTICRDATASTGSGTAAANS